VHREEFIGLLGAGALFLFRSPHVLILPPMYVALVPYVIDSAVKLRIDALAMTEPIRDKETDRQEVYRQAKR
jgi:hypothetical protein